MRVLSDQFDIPWSLGRDYVFPAVLGVDEYWEPSGNVCSVRRGPDQAWRVVMPDESAEPLPNVSIAWLLWHVSWWWQNAHRWVAGHDSLPPEKVSWPGSASLALDQVTQLRDGWVDILNHGSPHASTSAPFPKGRSLAGLAAWVNFELTKNIAEIGVVVALQKNAQPLHPEIRQGGR